MGFPWAEVTELLSRQPSGTLDRPVAVPVLPGSCGEKPLALIGQAIRAGRYQAALGLLAREGERSGAAGPALDHAQFQLRLAMALAYGSRPGRRWQARALAQLQEATRLEPAGEPGRRLRAVVALYGGNAGEALALYPERPPPGLDRARWAVEHTLIALAAGRPEEVRPRLESAERPAGWPLEQNLAECLGACYWHRGDWAAALTWWEKAVALGVRRLVGPLGLCYHRAAAACQDSDPEQALAWWEAAARLRPIRPPGRAARRWALRLRLFLAWRAWEASDTRTALLHWQRARELIPGHRGARRGVTLAHLALGDGKAAARVAGAGKATAGGRSGVYLHLLRASALILSGEVEPAAADTLRLAREGAADVRVDTMCVLLLLATGWATDAVRRLAPLLERDPAPPLAVKAAVLAARATGDVNQAVNLLGGLLTADPADPWALCQWRELMLEQGIRAAEEGRPGDARKYFASVLLQNHDDPEAWFQTGVSHLVEGDPEAAEDCFSEAVRHSPRPARVLLAVCDRLLRAGETGAARRYLRQARRCETSSSFAVDAAHLCLAAGADDWALEVLREAVAGGAEPVGTVHQILASLHDNGCLDRAVPFLEAAPRSVFSARTWLLLTLLYIEKHNWAAAERALDRARTGPREAASQLAEIHAFLSQAVILGRAVGSPDRANLARSKAILLEGVPRDSAATIPSGQAVSLAALGILREQARCGWGVPPPEPGPEPPPQPPAGDYRGPRRPLLAWWLQVEGRTATSNHGDCLKALAALGSVPASTVTDGEASPSRETLP
ncbi:MAG: hypothetical protein RDU89_08735 [bacterium]|nr:hypothetical protein [bacterium]